MARVVLPVFRVQFVTVGPQNMIMVFRKANLGWEGGKLPLSNSVSPKSVSLATFCPSKSNTLLQAKYLWRT